MSPRRNRPHRAGGAQPDAAPALDRLRYGGEATVERGGRDWRVRSLAGGDKTYRCPGCDQEIAPGTPHVVAWSADGDADDRRHWHRACWSARDRRAPNVQRGRSAPKHG